MALSINTDLSKFDIPTSNTGGSLAQEFGSYCLLSQQIRLEDNFRNEKIPTSNGRFKKKEKINDKSTLCQSAGLRQNLSSGQTS